MDGRTWALVLAVIALALGVVAQLRARRKGSTAAPLHGALLLGPCAIIIGTVPWVLQLSETVRIVASIASIVVSLAAMVLLVIQIARKPTT